MLRRAVSPAMMIQRARRRAGYRRWPAQRQKVRPKGETVCMSITTAMTSVPKPRA